MVRLGTIFCSGAARAEEGKPRDAVRDTITTSPVMRSIRGFNCRRLAKIFHHCPPPPANTVDPVECSTGSEDGYGVRLGRRKARQAAATVTARARPTKTMTIPPKASKASGAFTVRDVLLPPVINSAAPTASQPQATPPTAADRLATITAPSLVRRRAWADRRAAGREGACPTETTTGTRSARPYNAAANGTAQSRTSQRRHPWAFARVHHSHVSAPSNPAALKTYQTSGLTTSSRAGPARVAIRRGSFDKAINVARVAPLDGF